LKQTEAQQLLKIVDVIYDYTLTCARSSANATSFEISVDVPDDVVKDDVGRRRSAHHRMRRQIGASDEMCGLLVGQSLPTKMSVPTIKLRT
jgi:hypothetical protein